MEKRKVIVITDGDQIAQRAMQEVATRVGGRLISMSGGNPTRLSGEKIVEFIQMAEHDPVLVMVDDRGKSCLGPGEEVLLHLARSPQVELLGVVAVASDTWRAAGTTVDFSVDRKGNLVDGPVDKLGYPTADAVLKGDTVDVLRQLQVPVVVGVGDVGKQEGSDGQSRGVPVTVRAVEEILRRSGYHIGHHGG